MNRVHCIFKDNKITGIVFRRHKVTWLNEKGYKDREKYSLKDGYEGLKIFG